MRFLLPLGSSRNDIRFSRQENNICLSLTLTKTRSLFVTRPKDPSGNDNPKLFRQPPSRNLFVICCLTFGFFFNTTFSQRVFTLPDCIQIAMEKSYSARSAQERLKSSEANAEAARRALYSTVDLSFDIPDYSNALTQAFNSVTQRNEFFRTEIMQINGSLTVNQPIIWTNSTVSLSGRMYRLDQKTSRTNEFSRNFFGNVAVMLRQPLFVPNTQRISLRQAELDYQQSLSDYKRTMLDIVFSLTQSFNQLYSAQQRLTIQRDRVRQQEESYNTAQSQFKAGLIAEVEALQLSVDLASAKNDLLSSENEVLSQGNSFKLLIGLPLSEQITLKMIDTTFHRVSIDLPKAIEEGKMNRIELQRARNDIERSELSLDMVKSQRSIRGDLTLSYGLSKEDIVLDKLFVRPQDTRGAVFTLSIPIFDWGKHSLDVESAEARLRSAQLTAENTEQTIEQEIIQLVKRIESAASRVEVLSASEIVAQKAFEINQARFRVGTIGSTDLAQSQTRLTTARLSALEALLDYRVAIADLTRKTFYDFERNEPVNLNY